jgi:hypothetical protein
MTGRTAAETDPMTGPESRDRPRIRRPDGSGDGAESG